MGTGRQVSAPRAIVDFLAGVAPDDRDRYFHQILAWPDDLLESVHDYIQWLFPLTESSAFNPGAPVLDGETIAEVLRRPELQQAVRESFIRMLSFYGLHFRNGEVREAANFMPRSANWLTPGNHNHLRITRILKSLTLLGLTTEAQAFYRALTGIVNTNVDVISPRTYKLWTTAVS